MWLPGNSRGTPCYRWPLDGKALSSIKMVLCLSVLNWTLDNGHSETSLCIVLLWSSSTSRVDNRNNLSQWLTLNCCLYLLFLCREALHQSILLNKNSPESDVRRVANEMSATTSRSGQARIVSNISALTRALMNYVLILVLPTQMLCTQKYFALYTLSQMFWKPTKKPASGVGIL